MSIKSIISLGFRLREMPATRPHVDRAAKAREILEAAESLFLRDGYEATTVASVARRAGISSNAVYWYFSSKDELLAAVLRYRQEQAFHRLESQMAASLEEQALAILRELDSLASLTAAVHERADHSPAVAKAHEEFHTAVEARLREGLKAKGMPDEDASMATAALIAMVEGIHLHRPSRDAPARNSLVLWVIQSFVSGMRRADEVSSSN